MSCVFLAKAQICKYEKNEVDPITNEIFRTTKTRITSPSPFYITTFYRLDHKYQIKVEVGDNGQQAHTIHKGSELALRTGDGDVISIYAIADAEPFVNNEFGDPITEYIITYDIEEEDMKKIAKSGISFMRVQDLQNTFSNLKVPEVVQELIQFDVSCLFK